MLQRIRFDSIIDIRTRLNQDRKDTITSDRIGYEFETYIMEINIYFMSVKVGVRVRPFNKREKELGCKLVVDMQDPLTILKANDKETERKFTFDYSLWSFDEFKEEANGYFCPTSSKYADQKQVFERIGKKILDNAYEGYHCCLFAYGQTGSGKSYSMIGFGENKGIVPIACNEIFERIKKKDGDQTYEVQASMIQIYNEDIQDLTVEISERPAGGLKVRESKLLGIYVDGVKKHFVESFEQIEKVMERGTKNRTIAATQMNATSSRAHTIITIELRQKKTTNGVKVQRVSLINLIDLAGSERQSKTGATGDRLKEAVGINLSLTTLGQVISILAENSEGANKFVPYRNSSLTRILQNALGGNSQTVMICAISPASDNYEETLSTLRYADQAKKIKNKPVINESETDKLIRELRNENERLRKLLEQWGTGPQKNVSTNKEKENQESEEDIAANLNALSKLMDDQLKTKEEKRKEAQQQEQEDKKKTEELAKAKMQEKILDEKEIEKMEVEKKKLPPYLENISRDIMLNRKLKILLQKKHIRIGKQGCTPPNQIIFGGRDMIPKHATLDIDQSGNVMLTPLNPECHLYVNGLPVREKTVLKHLDRIIFGWNSVYLFKDKEHRRDKEDVKSKDIDWEFVKKEVTKFVDIDQSDSEEGGGCCSIF